MAETTLIALAADEIGNRESAAFWTVFRAIRRDQMTTGASPFLRLLALLLDD